MRDNFIRGIKIDWDIVDQNSYLRDISSIQQIHTLSFNKNITFFSGENGSGKSTLLEAIAVAYGFNAEGGTINYRFSTYESHSELYEAVTVIKGSRKPRNNYFLRAESFYNVASKAEEYRDGDCKEIYYSKYGGKSLHQQSHGESFLNLIQGNFSSNGIYIMDEPEAALSPQRQLTLLREIYELSQNGSQFIIASHSPILLGIPEAEILSFSTEGVQVCDYLQTESYQLTEMFINNRQYFLNHLLS